MGERELIGRTEDEYISQVDSGEFALCVRVLCSCAERDIGVLRTL